MAKRNLKPDDVIVKIMLDIKIDGKMHKDVELIYKPEKNWCLTWSDIHWEDNDSWYTADIGDEVWDIQITGEDDELARVDNPYDDTECEYSPSKAVKIPLHVDGCIMYKENPDVDVWSHGDDWLNYHNTKYSNVRIFTKDGKCERVRVVNY